MPFNRATLAPNQEKYVIEAMQSGHLSGDGPFTSVASKLLSDLHGGSKVLLTTSCTSALEMAGVLIGISAGDEVIVPSFTFVSTANAFALLGAKILFADIDPTTFNITAETVKPLIGPNTKAIVPVNYGGAPAVTPDLVELASRYQLKIIEDNAHGLFGRHGSAPLGTLSEISTLSFHETKNITSGEGGAIVVNNPELWDRAEVTREKGTNRAHFFRGMVDKYTWVDKGSSYLMSDVNAAMLLAQIEFAEVIQNRRKTTFEAYMCGLESWAQNHLVQLPAHLWNESSPAHLFPIVMQSLKDRTELIEHARTLGVSLAFHYVPLHDSPGGRKFGEVRTDMSVTNRVSECLVRLPLFSDATQGDADRVLDALTSFRV